MAFDRIILYDFEKFNNKILKYNPKIISHKFQCSRIYILKYVNFLWKIKK